MPELLFGTGGVPHSAKDRSVPAGVRRISELGLGCMEVEFVHGVRIRREAAGEAGKTAAGLGVTLTCHGPYYINLNSEEPEKREASVRRILDTARAAHWLGAVSFTFHPAFMMKKDPEEVYRVVSTALAEISATVRQEGLEVRISPELTGKPTQFGSLEELLRLSREVENIHPCIDFSHYHARTGGAQNSYGEFCGTLEAVGKALGKPALEQLHMHVSGINYTGKGERNHLDLPESDLKYVELLRALKEFEVGGQLICESPSLEEDARLLKDTYLGL
ncbi:MAG: TIM barrel protein [Candidatus Glassbacteria bacterium]|nr:TIM barrel protein [Candidatus Glassbacteria bacterium]